MKVTLALSLLLLVVACSSASPMFGTGGMMKRKFPGASDMSYQTYRQIANSNARGGTPSSSAAAAGSGLATRAGDAAAVPRTGGSTPRDNGWMFGNGLAAPSSSSQPGSFIQHRGSFYPQGLGSQNLFEGRYPSVWEPRNSYAFLQFPYHAPAPLDYETDYDTTQSKIYRNYY